MYSIKKIVNHYGRDYSINYIYRQRSSDLIVFLHGIGCSQDSFADAWVISYLMEFSILTFDFIGYGNSSKPEDFSYTMEDQADICEKLIKNYPEQRIHIVVHSMGGAIGLLLSDNMLKSAISFANIEGNLISEDCDLVSRKTINQPYKEFEAKYIKRCESPSDKDKKKYFDLNQTSPIAFYKSCESLVEWSDSGILIQKFKSLNCKKAYFYGDKNSDMKILAELDGIEKIKIDNSGHFVMNDNPEEFYSKLYSLITNTL